ALTRMCDLAVDPVLAEHNPLVAHAAGLVGDPQVRHRATLGGSVAHGDPASDPPTVLLALDAELVVQGPSGSRTVPAGEFFVGLFETALAGHVTDAVAAAAEHAPEGTSPISDTNASAEYRGELSKVLVRRALEEALAR